MFKSAIAAVAFAVAAAAGSAQAMDPSGSNNPSIESYSAGALVQQSTAFHSSSQVAWKGNEPDFSKRLYNPSTEGYVGAPYERRSHVQTGQAREQKAERNSSFDWVGNVQGGA